MNHHRLVLPEHLNDHGTLFGGYLLKWVDEFAYITASLLYPKRRFVTIALQNVVFRHRIECGQVLRFSVEEVRRGKTSVTFDVQAFRGRRTANTDEKLFETTITFVCVDANGQKTSVSDT